MSPFTKGCDRGNLDTDPAEVWKGTITSAKNASKLHYRAKIRSFIRKGRKIILSREVYVGYILEIPVTAEVLFQEVQIQSQGRRNVLGWDKRMSLSPYYGLSSHPAPHFSTSRSPGNNLNREPMLQGETQLNNRARKNFRDYPAPTPQRYWVTCLKPHSLVFLTGPMLLPFPCPTGRTWKGRNPVHIQARSQERW